MYRTRYAPSPTGAMHLGHARTALLAWLRARSLGGRIVMRIEDLDPPRVKPGAADAILRDHAWLGLDWDEGPVYQSARTEAYEEALAQLTRDGRVYACTCTRKEIEAALSSAPHAGDPGGELVYPGTCRPAGLAPGAPGTADAPDAEHAAGRAGGVPTAPEDIRRAQPNRPAALRFALSEGDAAFERFVDVVQGPVTAPLGGDFVVRRSDGLFAYQLAVVVDDAAQGITEVLRGDDLLGSTPRQLALYAALGHPAPAFGHLGLVLADEGGRLSKRLGSVGIADYVAAGVPKERILGWLGASLGLVEAGEDATLGELLARFELGRVPRGTVRAPGSF